MQSFKNLHAKVVFKVQPPQNVMKPLRILVSKIIGSREKCTKSNQGVVKAKASYI